MEREWIEAAQRGDKVAFSRLVRAHQDAVYRYAMYYTGSDDVGRELAQETLLRFYRTLDRFEVSLPVRPWLLRIVANLCKDHFKRRRVEARHRHMGEPPAEDEVPGDPEDRPDRKLQRVRELEQVRLAVAELRDDYREPLLMKCVEGLTYEEMHAVTGLPITTLKIRVVRAREQLRLTLEAAEASEGRRRRNHGS